MSQDCSSWKTGVHLNAWGSSHLRCGQGGLGSKDDFIMNRGWKSIRKQILPYLSTLIYMFCALGDKSNTIPQRPTPYLRFMRAQYHVWMLTHPEAEMPTIKLHLEGPVARRPRGVERHIFFAATFLQTCPSIFLDTEAHASASNG